MRNPVPDAVRRSDQAGAAPSAVQDTLAQLRRRVPDAHADVAVVLGTGWGDLTGKLGNPRQVPYALLDGFPQTTVDGHAGQLWLGRLGEVDVAIMQGRKHAYEGGAADGMLVALRTLQALGCQVLVQTNAAGSLDPTMPPGSLMLVADHINFAQRSPLLDERGANRFVGLADAYDPALRRRALALAASLGIPLREGVYLWCLGPQFETPAEIRAFRLLGADAVGMSTVPETIIARHAGMRVLALSLITNLAAGLAREQLSHALTLERAQAASAMAGDFLAQLVRAVGMAESTGAR